MTSTSIAASCNSQRCVWRRLPGGAGPSRSAASMSNVVETPHEVADTIRAALDTVPPERLYPCTNCGMAPMSSEIAYAKLASLAAGAELARKAVQ